VIPMIPVQRYTIQRDNKDYLHISSVGSEKPPFWTRDERDSAIFASQYSAQKHIDKIGVKAKVVLRSVKENCI
jgi:hypothetical protein